MSDSGRRQLRTAAATAGNRVVRLVRSRWFEGVVALAGAVAATGPAVTVMNGARLVLAAAGLALTLAAALCRDRFRRWPAAAAGLALLTAAAVLPGMTAATLVAAVWSAVLGRVLIREALCGCAAPAQRVVNAAFGILAPVTGVILMVASFRFDYGDAALNCALFFAALAAAGCRPSIQPQRREA